MNDNPFFLLIETATEVCSVALSQKLEVIDKKEILIGQSHAQNLIPLIDEIFKNTNVPKDKIKAIGLSSGPGSYTGLRIGASTAKGLCFTLNIPLISISTLQNIMLGAVKQLKNENVIYCPMIDARRMEVFYELYDHKQNLIKNTEAIIVEENTFSTLLKDHQVVFCGNGITKCKNLLITHSNAFFSNAPLSASNMATVIYQQYIEKQFENIASFEPFYLKDYIAKKSVVKGLI
ncbi:MAG: tRNA (adenosine(37)-N6)-threonylcarbamoyltransferase complex dimerization subunit type 1 TsaB [Bacteroidales bacterium]|jgi:tRNA threonylcarbamoyladenosine biosynthesis protein TsaB|nr:tRNA (adenosine(37)-N6)-threonylcarbamoyltransferase complex dimerization subunit type 1 TsaB [Bacteroidales bacterium]